MRKGWSNKEYYIRIKKALLSERSSSSTSRAEVIRTADPLLTSLLVSH